MGAFKSAAGAVTDWTSNDNQYCVEVNKNDLNVGRMASQLNSKWRDGWRLAHVLEQKGNTVMVFERRAAA
jgi:hypothetical protein